MYGPILKGKAGEFEAWERVSSNARAQIRPMFEIVLASNDKFDIHAFCTRAVASCQAGDQLSVDATRYLPLSHWRQNRPGVYVQLGKALSAASVTFSPVIELGSPIQVVHDAAAAPASDGITLRITDTVIDAYVRAAVGSATSVRPEEWLSEIQIPTQNLHLLIDLGGISGRSVVDAQQQAQAGVDWATLNGPWKTITLASGAFPLQISDVPVQTAYRIPRVDADVWNRVRAANPNLQLQYGDYAVKDGAPPRPGGGFPYPNIRYTSDTEWVVWREKKLGYFPNSSIYAAYAGIVRLPDFKGASFSWGDHEISTKSTHTPAPKGAGGGQAWLCIGFNHHLEFVVDRLSRLGVA